MLGYIDLSLGALHARIGCCEVSSAHFLPHSIQTGYGKGLEVGKVFERFRKG